MSYMLPAPILAALGKGTVRSEVFFRFRLVDGDFLIWSGMGDIRINGERWRGSRLMGRLPELEQLLNGEATRVTIEVSGVSDDAVAALIEEAATIEGRELDMLLGLFDERGSLIDSLIALDTMMMDEVVDDQTVEGMARTNRITLDIASPLMARATASHALWTHEDQQSLYPGDMGCERNGMYQSRETPWPQFS
ncbi:hypothetical protein [Zavarzinia sp.]|uniref:hypothetical protein n=1 Tax=Zavarzinia sp. TaxID=2027920 RepID=UPI003BB4AA66